MNTSRRTLFAAAAGLPFAPRAQAQARWQFATPYQDTNFHTRNNRQFVEELTDKAPHYEIGNQTEFIIEREETPFNIPIKRGVDKKTLVQDNELFKFDREVEPILSVLCGKTLEFARMEVLEEEELRTMKG